MQRIRNCGVGILLTALCGFGDVNIPRDGLVAWFDAADISGLSQGSPVIEWPVKDGMAGVNPLVDWNTSDDYAPVYHSQHQSFNGLPCVYFSDQVRDNDYLVSQNMFSHHLSGRSVTVFFVSKSRRLGVLNYVAPRAFFAGHTLTFGSGTASTFSIGDTASTAIRAYTIDVSEKNAKGWLDGNFKGTLDLSDRPESDFSYGHTRGFRVGAAATGESYSGYMAEIIVYNRVLTPDEMRSVGSYLADKYGISSAVGTNKYAESGALPVVGLSVQVRSKESYSFFLPSIFADNMVLQESSTVPVWGRFEPGREVAVKASWLDEPIRVLVSEDGDWKIDLQTPQASFVPHTVDVQAGEQCRTYKNVLIGQVWLCSGQSNMGYALRRTDAWEEETIAADYPYIRTYQGKQVYSPFTLRDAGGAWIECSPSSAPDFSAVVYYFGKELFKKLDKPIGLIHFSWGGTPIETWMRLETLERIPDYNRYLQTVWTALDAKYPESKNEYDIAMEKWRKGEGERPVMPRELRLQNKPGYCFNGMIAPTVGYSIAGVIWYQGEANCPASNHPYYQAVFRELITDWRHMWKKDDLPFLFVQLAASTGYGIGVAHIRQAQMMTLKTIPHTGMAVTMDIGDASDHHPGNKRDVGYRLSLWALKNVYGFNGIVPSGPLYLSKEIEGDSIRLYFDHIGQGLMAKNDAPLSDFSVCAEDGQFYPATAAIDGDTIVVQSGSVPNPTHASFAWVEYAEPNFYNRAGLPASPFNTLELENKVQK